MTHVVYEGFEEQSEPLEREKPTSLPVPPEPLASFLADSTIGALRAGVDHRAEVGLFLPSACFDVRPVEGDLYSWTIRVLPYPDPIVGEDVHLWFDLFNPSNS